jgi:hypothetical protein
MDASTIVGEAETYEHDQLFILAAEVRKLDAMADSISGLMMACKGDAADTGVNLDEAIETLAGLKVAMRRLDNEVRHAIEAIEVDGLGAVRAAT